MLIRTYADITKLKGKAALSPAEKTLIENCKLGEPTILGDGTRPDGPSPERTIRADLLRYLILGGCEQCRVHETGVQLIGAWIAGELDLSYSNTKGAVLLVRCSFGESMAARQAHLHSLMLNGCKLPSLMAWGAVIRGSAFLRDLTTAGEVSFSSAEIGGSLFGIGAKLSGMQSRALNAQGSKISGDVVLDNLDSTGEVSFSGAEIGGQLSSEHGQLNGGKGVSLNAESATIRGGVFLKNLKSIGEISFSGTEIGGQFSAQGLELDGGEGKALNAQSVMIKRGVFLRTLVTTGEVSFVGALIEGQFLSEGSDLNGGNGRTLNAQGAKIKGDVFLDNLKSTGQVSFGGAEIGGQFSCEGAALNGRNGKALDGQDMFIAGGFFWREVEAAIGIVDLNSARIGTLVDDEQSWNKVSSLRLVGLTYENLAGSLDLPFRKRWLQKGAHFHGQFHPQPYQQLAKVYRETGHRHEAREVLVEKEVQHRKAVRAAIREGRDLGETGLHPQVRIAINWLWDWSMRLGAGYGYKPWLALGWLAGMVAVVTVLANLTWSAGDFAPNSAVVLTSPDWKAIADGPSANPAADWSDTLAPGKDYETFYAFAYALDVVVPVLDLGQTDAWAPSPARGDWGWWMFYLQKTFIVLGWVVTAIAAAAISGMIRRDD